MKDSVSINWNIATLSYTGGYDKGKGEILIMRVIGAVWS